MTEVTITINDHVSKQLRALPGALGNAVQGSIEDTNNYLLRLMTTYPPPRPAQKYIRTGTLRRSWSKRIEGSGLSARGRVVSSASIAPYNRDVQSRATQGFWFVGRWQTAESVTEASTQEVQRFVETRINAALSGL